MGYNVDFDSSAPVFENHTNFNIDNVVPEKRNNTYGSDAVHRKSMNELLSTSFSEDQQKVLAYALEGGGGGCDCGFECTETARVAYDGQFTADTSYNGSYASMGLTYDGTLGESDEVTVTFEGTKYVAPRVEFGTFPYYGAPFSSGVVTDWSEYPFCIMPGMHGGMMAIVQQQGTYTMKVEEVSTEVTTDTCFEEAVKKVVSEGDSVEVITFVEGQNCGYTPAEIKEKLDADNVVFKFRTTTIASHANVPVSVEPIYGNGGFEGIRVYAFRTDSFGNSNITVERYNVDVDGTLIKNATRTIALTSNN